MDQQWVGNFQFVFAAQKRKQFFYTVHQVCHPLHSLHLLFFFFLDPDPKSGENVI